MILERKQLLLALSRIKAALAKGIVEEFGCVWFDGKRMVAQNDQGFGIATPFESEVVGGVNGLTFIGLVVNTKTKEIELSNEDNNLIIKGGRAKAKLALLPIERMPAKVPNVDKGDTFTPTPEMYGALGNILISATNPKSAVPEQAGITLVGNNAFMLDEHTMARAACKLALEERVTIPIAFVKQLLSISKGIETKLCFKKSMVWAHNANAIIFSPLLGNDDPADVISMSNNVLKECEFVPIPARLKLAMLRANALIKDQKEAQVKVSTKGEVIKILTKTPQGELKDAIPLEKTMPEAEITIDPKIVERGLSYCDKIAITNRAVVMARNDFYYMIAGS